MAKRKVTTLSGNMLKKITEARKSGLKLPKLDGSIKMLRSHYAKARLHLAREKAVGIKTNKEAKAKRKSKVMVRNTGSSSTSRPRTVKIAAHTRKDGVKVKAHTRHVGGKGTSRNAAGKVVKRSKQPSVKTKLKRANNYQRTKARNGMTVRTRKKTAPRKYTW